ncbi:MAG: hypothetical protein GY832_41045 [Chloroflexi bacterium]|nr:hypothetical protein [Chloroflexota bacterium]
MFDKAELRSLIQDTMQAFSPFYQEAMGKAIQESDAPNSWFGLSLAHGSDPQPFTIERYQEMAPYASPGRFVEMLEELAQLELLERVGEEAYRLTDLGRGAVEHIFDAAHQGIGSIEPLPADEMDRLNSLLHRVVQATLDAPEPAEKWAMAYSRWTDPGEDAPGAAKTDQYLTDLLRYRDDAHIAAWKPYDVSGHAWEAFTFIWRDELGTADELVERLPFRAHPVEEYQKALQDLAGRGWLVEEAGAYKLTDKGKQVREEAEEATDRHFFVGWSALSKEELTQLQDLLSRAKLSLQKATLSQLGSLTRELSGTIPGSVRDSIASLFEENGLNKPGFFGLLLSAQNFEPDLISTARLGIRDPYTSPKQYDNILNELAKVGFLTPKSDGEYKLADKGRTTLNTVNGAFYDKLGEISVLTEDDLTQIETLLDKVAQACLDAPEPENKWAISKTRQGHLDQEYALLAQIDQHLDDLNAFRDDVHLAAWKPYDVSGPAWEALTFVWRGDARTAEELGEKLPFRNHDVTANTATLAHLASRGWVQEVDDGYQITEKGQALRQQTEEATDSSYFAPWKCLSTTEMVQLHNLLTRLKNGLQELAENNENDAEDVAQNAEDAAQNAEGAA